MIENNASTPGKTFSRYGSENAVDTGTQVNADRGRASALPDQTARTRNAKAWKFHK